MYGSKILSAIGYRKRPYKKHSQNEQFDVSLLENFRKNMYLFHHFFENFRIFFQNSPIGGHKFFLYCYFVKYKIDFMQGYNS